MPTKECKECAAQIEEGDKDCPKCGSSTSNKMFPIIATITIFIGVALYFIISEYSKPSKVYGPIIVTSLDPSPVAKLSSADENKTKKVKKPPPTTEWTISTKTDGRANELSYFANSPTTKPLEQISYQYRNIEAWMSIGCKSDVEWAFVGFNMSPIIGNTITEDGYDVIVTTLRWDDVPKKTFLKQKWSTNYLHFSNGAEAILRLSTADSVLLELSWLEGQTVKFKFSLKGSTSSLRSIRKSCASFD